MRRRPLTLVATALLLLAGAGTVSVPAVAGGVGTGAASAAAGPFASGAAAPGVKTRIVGKSRTLMGTRTVTASATTVAIGRKRCAVAAGTPLAALLAAQRSGGPKVKLTDYGSCGARAADGGGIYVTQVGPDKRGGQAGWVYAVDGRVGTAGAADTTGPFGSGLLRGGQRVVWFWCANATACERVP